MLTSKHYNNYNQPLPNNITNQDQQKGERKNIDDVLTQLSLIPKTTKLEKASRFQSLEIIC